jgi:CRP-like cAMP-binding protein
VDLLITKLERRDRLTEAEKACLDGVWSPPRVYKPGQDIVREGSRPKESTIVLSGFCGRYNTLLDGRRQISALHIGGDFVDLHSFLLKVMDHGVTALSECKVVTVPHEVLTEITERQPHLTRMLWLSTLIDASINRRWIVAMGRLQSNAQFAHLICELRVRLGIIGQADDSGYDFPLTQTEVADVLGLSLVHVNRVVQELRREQLIAWSGRRITILDWDRLCALAEFEEGYLHLETEPR